MKKILIVLLNVVIIFAFVGLNFTESFASEASISVSGTVTVGTDFTVTVNIPAEAVGYNGEIVVKFSNGTTNSSGNLAVVTGVNGDYTHPGNMSYTFNAASEGTATITVTNLKITDRNANRVNSQTTLETSINVVSAQTPTTPTTTPPASNEPSWTNTGDTVYTTEVVNVREGTGTNYRSLGKLSKGTSITRIAKGSNGWDKVSFKGQNGYVSSQYLTTQNPDGTTNTSTPDNSTTDSENISWNETGDKVYATTSMNVRNGCGTDAKIVGGLAKGDSVKRIAVGSTGWDKISYNGETAYVLSRLLTTEVVEKDEEDENNVTDDENTNTADVTANMAENELDVYNQIIEEVGVLPTVGRSMTDYVYIIAVCLSLAMIGFVSIKIREKNEE